MSSKILSLQEKYYEYGAEGLKKLLAIVGYKSALLEYFVASYLFEVTINKSNEVLWNRIYRDTIF